MKQLEGYVQQEQQQPLWCWLAVACSVAEFRERSGRFQCLLARDLLMRSNCCAHPSACNETGSLGDALQRTGGLAEPPHAPVELETLQRQINFNIPVGIRIERDDGTAHVMVVAGYDDGVGPDCVLTILDPWTGPDEVTYGVLRNSWYRDGRWTHTYFTM